MIRKETIQDYYINKCREQEKQLLLDHTEVSALKVFPRSAYSGYSPFRRRDFYKISLIIGTGYFRYAQTRLALTKPALLFFNPRIAYSWEAQSKVQSGWHCLFTDTFLQANRIGFWQFSRLFQTGDLPVFYLNKEQQKTLSYLFEKLREEVNSAYAYKFDVLTSYLHLILHEALKVQPASVQKGKIDASAEIARLFVELLEKQFPVYTPEEPVTLRTPADFARELSIHTNHLNRVLKSVTGKTSTALIAARFINEAIALLNYSNLNISEIAYALGFEHPSNFNSFFKRHTGTSPLKIRDNIV
ncbi:AraC family transcriptional regulator [Chitinophaga sp. MD30]|nr:AraC family transcriptional regulator [Chitinophaga sp. MD30]